MPADCWSAGIVIFAMLTCAFLSLSILPHWIQLVDSRSPTYLSGADVCFMTMQGQSSI